MKDRGWLRPLDGGVRIVVRRSSAVPIIYAITLVAVHDGQEYAVPTYDNAHAVDEHHVHRYIGEEKQPPTVKTGDVNRAMAAAMSDLLENWRRYVEEWKGTLP